MLASLSARRPVEEPVALLVAHPDDETLAIGGSLHLFRRLLLIHVTDGAPRRLDDAVRQGFAGPADYAAAREAELCAALALSGAAPERVRLGVADQEATDAVGAIVEAVTALIRARGIQTVLTHPYEGGHPDHDALAVAASRLGTEVIEFTGYHLAAGAMRTGTFLEPSPPGRGLGEGAATLPSPDLARKRAMLACFHTQRDILSRFDPAVERFRPAPSYDFAQPPHPGRLLYEEWGWMTGAAWRERVRCA